MTADPPSPLSRGTLALWGLTPGGRRGPKPAMSVRSIAAAGIALADADGLEAVTMSAVARRLGFTTMALYRHVESHTDLLAVMADEALGPLPDLSRRKTWRSQLVGWALAEAKQLFAHPWFLDIRTGSPPVGPRSLGWMDLGLQVLTRAGLGHAEASSALLLVDGYVRSTVVFAFQYGASEAADAWADSLRLVVDAEVLPAVAAALEAGVFEDEEAVGFPNDDFTFGLEVILDGIERLLPD